MASAMCVSTTTTKHPAPTSWRNDQIVSARAKSTSAPTNNKLAGARARNARINDRRSHVYGVTIARGSAAAERGQPSDRSPCALFGHTKLVEALQVEPELGARAEEVAQAQRRIAGDRASAVKDRGHAVRGDLELTGELRGAHVERLQLLGELITGMNRETCHRSLL